MKAILKKILNLFTLKSPCCNYPMKSIDIHKVSFGSENIIYECKKCKEQWI